MPQKGASSARLRFGPKNTVLLSTAVLSLATGYLLLARGSTTLAPILLVLGYCVLFPLGLAL
jgi:nitrate/nitrite transporter NarK